MGAARRKPNVTLVEPEVVVEVDVARDASARGGIPHAGNVSAPTSPPPTSPPAVTAALSLFFMV